MAYTTIDDPSENFQIALYTGNGNSGKNIPLSSANYTDEYVGATMAPDLVWIKNRAISASHVLTDTTRGATKSIFADQNNGESTEAQQLTAFGSNDFTLGTSNNVNDADEAHVAWCWKANGGTRTTNTESGNNPAGGYQANTTAGFSIVDYTGTGAAGTMAHGLGAVPKVMIVRNRDENSVDWAVYHRNASAAGNDSYLELNTTDAAATAGTVWNDTSPTSSVFTIGSNTKTNKDGVKYIAYLFAEKQGYFKAGQYTSNNNADGPFIYCGFKPACVITKMYADAGTNWRIYDNLREGINGDNEFFELNRNSAESGSSEMDFHSNGFKLVDAEGDANYNDLKVLYFAWAESPFVSSAGVPTTAR